MLEPALGLATDIFPCEDGHAQERSLLSAVLETVEASDLWIGDRNWQQSMDSSSGLTTNKLLSSFANMKTYRQQATSELVEEGRTEGGVVFSQTGVVSSVGQELRCRRVVVQLDQPTRDGETEIALLTNLAESKACSILVAQLYRSRWRVETLFQVATQTKQL